MGHSTNSGRTAQAVGRQTVSDRVNAATFRADLEDEGYHFWELDVEGVGSGGVYQDHDRYTVRAHNPDRSANAVEVYGNAEDARRALKVILKAFHGEGDIQEIMAMQRRRIDRR